ncbi:hypothetical protein, partial [Paenibacillus sp. Y412MC10]|uniref:hypothetical protein n=1 Tax=Geobacillus sp. (strain Y412MC10) TaxID=481743 RepID=UPI0021B1DF12
MGVENVEEEVGGGMGEGGWGNMGVVDKDDRGLGMGDMVEEEVGLRWDDGGDKRRDGKIGLKEVVVLIDKEPVASV